jgi:hypothetical protein
VVGLHSDQVRLTDHLKEAIWRVCVVQAERQEVEVELGSLRSSTARVQDLLVALLGRPP